MSKSKDKTLQYFDKDGNFVIEFVDTDHKVIFNKKLFELYGHKDIKINLPLTDDIIEPIYLWKSELIPFRGPVKPFGVDPIN